MNQGAVLSWANADMFGRVVPAKAGTQPDKNALDLRFRGDDDLVSDSTGLPAF